MTKLEELIKELCPNGVEYKPLGELGFFYGGLSGKSKDDFQDGNAKFITYKNVYANPALRLDVDDRVRIGDGERQNTLCYGDIIFTGSSETPGECGISSVLTQHTDEKLYLNSFCFFFRFNESDIMLPDFAKHLFRSNYMRAQIAKTASGVTRFNVSKEKMKRVVIPLPPLAVQCEIVHILDEYTAKTEELKKQLAAELAARRKQYEYYRDKLLSFDENIENWERYNVQWKTIKEFGTVLRGKRLTKDLLMQNGLYPVYHGGLQPLGYYNLSNRKSNTVMIINVGASAGSVGYSNVDFWSSDGCYCIDVSSSIMDKFLYYALQRQEKYIQSRVRYAGIPTLDAKIIENIKIPVPPLAEQERIVAILDRFDKLCNDISEGLPAEIEARRKQYEYYRDKLLTFEEKIS